MIAEGLRRETALYCSRLASEVGGATVELDYLVARQGVEADLSRVADTSVPRSSGASPLRPTSVLSQPAIADIQSSVSRLLDMVKERERELLEGQQRTSVDRATKRAEDSL